MARAVDTVDDHLEECCAAAFRSRNGEKSGLSQGSLRCNLRYQRRGDHGKVLVAALPAGVPAEVDVDQYSSLVQLMDDGSRSTRNANAYAYMDRLFTFAEIDRHSAAFGAWLQGRGLARGARVAIMMPNVVQYPIALAGVLRAGASSSTSIRSTRRASSSTSSRIPAPRRS